MIDKLEVRVAELEALVEILVDSMGKSIEALRLLNERDNPRRNPRRE